MKSVDDSLTAFFSDVVVLEVLGELVVGKSIGWLLGELVVTGLSCFTDMTTTPMRVPNTTNTKNATPIFMNFLHLTAPLASASLSSSS
jgi:hypothetical protein